MNYYQYSFTTKCRIRTQDLLTGNAFDSENDLYLSHILAKTESGFAKLLPSLTKKALPTCPK